MIHEDWLQTVAEVSVALAGFSSLAAGMRRRDYRTSAINRTRLLTIVETSLSALFFSVLPVLFHGLGMGERTSYRVSAVLFLLGFVPLCTRGFRRFQAAAGTSSALRSSRLGLITLFAGLSTCVAGILCALDVLTASPSTLYLIALYGTLLIGAVNFTGFAASLVELVEHESSDESNASDEADAAGE